MTVLQQTNKLLAGIALAAGLISSGILPASAETEVRINQAFQSLLYLPLYVAQEKGYFADEGLKVTISTGGGGAQSWAAVIGGSADFSIQDPVFVPKTRENGGDGVVVAAIQNAPTVFIIGKDGTPLQDNLAHLSGKRVIVSPQPDTTWAFMSYLVKQQTLENVKLVNVSIGNEVPAIVSDRADYALAVEPQVTQSIRQNGLSSVYSFSANKDWFPFAFSSLTTTKDYISKNPEVAQGVITAFEMASRYIYKDFDGTVEIAAKYFPNLPKEIVAEAVKREIDAKGYPENVLVTKTSWDNNLNIALYAKNVKAYPSEATSYENNVNVELATKAKDIADAKFK
ncbi:ABC transporter substrate-binding protein [Pleomorphomonas carboxyditropha]|uniref:ABC transporter substrate-binding protein n=1 Tax=Pleomorphomonas carboxyditropha TaxID=2023338 RepID=A0A2G9WZE3_9HYPH|nr:ABC transporter substrate-binding protein [Pleomorphomonas carboxyditropha]PIP00076.1 ABC transporter substrate-binding protein [Pleomorphomonas carboxyditropha]